MSSFRYLLRALLERGPHFLWVYFTQAIFFDLVHGTNTHFRRPKQQVDHREYGDGVLYVASLTSTVRNSLRVVQNFLGPEFDTYQFVDLGAGKGKTLLVYWLEYSRRSRPQAVGIEYDDELCAVARENLRKMKIPAAKATVVCDSAVNVMRYCDGSSPGLVVYLYNPFQGETFREVVRQLDGVPHVLVYVDPVERGVLEAAGYRTLAFEQGRYHADTWMVATKGS